MKAPLLAALLALPALPALARLPQPQVPLIGTGASASLTGLRYEVIDLDANDGIEARVQFTGEARARAYAGAYFCALYSGCVRDEGSFSEPVLATTGDAQRSSFGAATPAGLFAGGQYEVGGLTRYRYRDYSGTARLRGTQGSPLFTLAANTAVRVTGQYTLDAWSVASTEYYQAERVYGSSGASVFIESRSLEGDAPRASIGTHITPPRYAPSFEHLTGELSAVFRNDLDRTAPVWGRIVVSADGGVPAVPEPSTWALMLAGAGVLGAMARRRARAGG